MVRKGGWSLRRNHCCCCFYCHKMPSCVVGVPLAYIYNTNNIHKARPDCGFFEALRRWQNRRHHSHGYTAAVVGSVVQGRKCLGHLTTTATGTITANNNSSNINKKISGHTHARCAFFLLKLEENGG